VAIFSNVIESSQFIPMSIERIKVAIFSDESTENVCSLIRLLDPLGQASDAVEILWAYDATTKQARLDFLDRADIIVVQRFFAIREFLPYLERILNCGKPVIYETDDLLHLIPEGHPRYQLSHDNRFPLLSFVAQCDAVTVSTNQLRSAYLNYNQNIYVLPNLINEERWGLNESTEPRQDAVSRPHIRIGFAGTSTHLDDLSIIEEVLARIDEKYGDRVSFTFLGCAPHNWRNLTNVIIDESFIAYPSFTQRLRRERFDIGLAPLRDNFFNSCKSNLKFLEYSACGIAGVYSDVLPYRESVRNGQTGILVKNEPLEWFKAIEMLLQNKALCQTMARAARNVVASHYSLAPRAFEYVEVYRCAIDRAHTDRPRHNKAVSLSWKGFVHYEAEARKLKSELSWLTDRTAYKLYKQARKILKWFLRQFRIGPKCH